MPSRKQFFSELTDQIVSIQQFFATGLGISKEYGNHGIAETPASIASNRYHILFRLA